MASPWKLAYVPLWRETRACPDSVALFLDPDLAILLHDTPSDPALASRLHGEALVRWWLYGRQCPASITAPVTEHCSDTLCGALHEVLTPLRKGRAQPEWPKVSGVSGGWPGADQDVWQWAVQRVRAYCACDGIIAVTGGPGGQEGIAVPFTVSAGEGRIGAVRDEAGHEVTQWTEELACVERCFQSVLPRVVLSCDAGQRAGRLEGDSFALAVLLATSRQQGQIGDYDPLGVLCTGAMASGGALQRVGSVPAKRRLGQRLGVGQFVYPGRSEDRDRDLGLAPGTPLQDCLNLISRRLDDLGLTRLDAYRAHARICELQGEVHQGLVALDTAAARVDRYAAAFAGDSASPYASEGMLYVHLLRGAIANHMGDPEAGRRHTREATQCAANRKQSRVYVDTVANLVVSLTDLGLLDQAEAAGRDLLCWTETGCWGSVDDRLYCRMKACGVLGGQPLLQKALMKPSLAPESRNLLQKALGCAREMRLGKEIARDAVQVALWYALHDPLWAEEAVAEAESQLGSDADVSRQYLLNTRFLAAYRAFLLGLPIPDGWADWPLPRKPNWLLATALKYRGALHGALGNRAATGTDFAESLRLFAAETTPLLRFIGATAALQAGESLRQVSAAGWQGLLGTAKTTFEALREVLHGIHRDPRWGAMTTELLSPRTVGAMPDVRSHYRY